jgi:hypothetical protein
MAVEPNLKPGGIQYFNHRRYDRPALSTSAFLLASRSSFNTFSSCSVGVSRGVCKVSWTEASEIASSCCVDTRALALGGTLEAFGDVFECNGAEVGL